MFEEFELALITNILRKDAPEFLPYLANLRLTERVFTAGGSGRYVKFSFDCMADMPRYNKNGINNDCMLLIQDVSLPFNSLLWFSDGIPDMLEIINVGDGVVPEDVSSFQVYFLGPQSRNYYPGAT